jgi:hypothetical protein
MHPARRLPDGTRRSTWEIEFSVAVIGIGLKDAGVSGEMCLGVFSLPVA